MPSLSNYATARPIKALYLGDPGSGKTGSLASLVAANFKLRIWDFDNLLEPLFQFVRRNSPDKLENVVYQTFTDKLKTPSMITTMTGAAMRVMPFTDGVPTAFATALRQLDHWKTESEDLGPPSSWGLDTFVVIDTLTQLALSAFRYCQAMNPAAKEPQTYYFAAQQLIVNVLAKLFSEQFNVNVIVLAHIDYDKNHLDLTKGFPRSIGSALNTQIGSYFNCVLLAESDPTGKNRVIRTQSTGIVDLKNPISFNVPERLPLESGLATFVKSLRGNDK